MPQDTPGARIERVLATTSAARPTVLVVEDIQWADDLTLVTLTHLARTADSCNLTLTLSVNPNDHHRRHAIRTVDRIGRYLPVEKMGASVLTTSAAVEEVLRTMLSPSTSRNYSADDEPAPLERVLQLVTRAARAEAEHLPSAHGLHRDAVRTCDGASIHGPIRDLAVESRSGQPRWTSPVGEVRSDRRRRPGQRDHGGAPRHEARGTGPLVGQ